MRALSDTLGYKGEDRLTAHNLNLNILVNERHKPSCPSFSSVLSEILKFPKWNYKFKEREAHEYNPKHLNLCKMISYQAKAIFKAHII